MTNIGNVFHSVMEVANKKGRNSNKKRLRPTALIRAVRLLSIAALRSETAPIRSQTRFAPTLHLASARAPAPLTPARPAPSRVAPWRSVPSAAQMPTSG